MANRLEFICEVASMLIFSLIFIFAFSSLLGEVLIAITLILMILAIFTSDSVQNAKFPASFSTAKFIVIIPPIIAMILSSGYLYSVIPYFFSVTPFQIQVFSFFVVLVEAFIVFSMIHETSKKIIQPLTISGYDIDELYLEMGNFSRSISFIVFFSLIVSMAITFFLAYGPQLSIGIIPSILLFVIVYVFVIYNYLNKSTNLEEK